MALKELVRQLVSHRRLLLISCAFLVILAWLSYVLPKRGKNTDPGTTTSLPQYDPSGPKDLLLFSYMRSGSSLTGELLRDSPRTFFVFEPLIPLAPYHYFTEEAVCRMRDTDCSTEKADDRIKEALDTVYNIFSCNIRAMPKVVIDEILKQNKSGLAWYKYGNCLKLNAHKKNKKRVERCLLNIENNCRKANLRVAKILRMDFPSAEKILRKLPNLKLLLLFRDPRAIMNSRIKTDWFPVSENDTDVVRDNVNSLCTKMENDLNTFQKSKWLPSTRVTVRKIEDLTSNKEEMLNIFGFVNKNITIQDERRIKSIVTRNSRHSLFREWQDEIRTDYRMHTEERCNPILKFYGYA